MQTWYSTVRDNLEIIPEFIEYYEKEYNEAKKEVWLLGSGSIEKASAGLSHIFENRFAQLQDIEAILEHLNISYRKLRSDTFKKFFENIKSQRDLTARECEKYVDSDEHVNSLAELINEVSLTRNLFLSILKGLDSKSYQINNIVKLKCAGLSDAEI